MQLSKDHLQCFFHRRRDPEQLTRNRRCSVNRWLDGLMDGGKGQRADGGDTWAGDTRPGRDQSGTSSATLWHNAGHTFSLSLSLSPSPLLFLSPLDSVGRTGEFSEAFYWKGVQWRRRGRVGKREEGEGGDGEGEAEEGRLGGGGGAHWDLRNKTLQTDKSGTDSAPGLPSFWPWALAQVASSL